MRRSCAARCGISSKTRRSTVLRPSASPPAWRESASSLGWRTPAKASPPPTASGSSRRSTAATRRARPIPTVMRAVAWGWASRSRVAWPRCMAAPSPSPRLRRRTVSRAAVASPCRFRERPSLPQLDVFIGARVRKARDGPEARFLDAGPDAVEEGELPDRRIDDALVHELLDPVKCRLATLRIQLDRLLLEEPIDVGIAAIDVRAAGGDERFQPRRGVAERAAATLHDVPEFLLAVGAEERCALERAELRADADRLQIVLHGFREARIRHVARVIACVVAVWIPGLGEQPLGLRRIVGGGRRLPEKLEDIGDDAVRDPREAERLGLVDGVAIEGQAHGLAELDVVPRRLRVPLLGEIDPERPLQHSRLEL